MPKLAFFIYCCGISLSFFLLADEQDIQKKSRRIQAHFCIKDFQSAHEEAQQAVACYPQSAVLHEAYIRSLARLGREKDMLKAWESYLF